ncbi:MAG: right-handed parallel beta-helix repeat-containing protein [Verrucomicrobiia bacterium]|jgi:hypothetical protein
MKTKLTLLNIPTHIYFLILSIGFICCGLARGLGAVEIWVDAATGSDKNTGLRSQPLRSFQEAVLRVKSNPLRGKEPIIVWFREGKYYLENTIVIDSGVSGEKGAPVKFAAAAGEKAVISGGRRLELKWSDYGNSGILVADTPGGLQFDQLFLNGKRQILARYPNKNPEIRIFKGYARDAISPERVKRWKDPSGGYLHALQQFLWGSLHYRINGKNPDNNTLELEGGWQNNRPTKPHPEYRFVEGIFEELDAPGEWFLDTRQNKLYYYPPSSPAGTDLIEVPVLKHLIEFKGSAEKPVKYVFLEGFTFEHTRRTFMETREPLLRSDWAIYRGGAVFLTGVEDCKIADCDFNQVGGNAVFVSGYGRRVVIERCHIWDAGANAIAFVGKPEAVRNPINFNKTSVYEEIDKEPGPRSNEFPADCIVEDCLIHNCGEFEKQIAGVEISMAQNITVRSCSIYELPRAGINIGDGCWGGHIIEFCDVFDTVLETGDHGSFNSWGRDRFWGLKNAPPEKLPELSLLDVVNPIVIRNSRWRCDHGWDIDLDDGSSNYRIYNNLLLRGGLKLREGFHRIVTNNICINNGLHLHVWFTNSQDYIARNILMASHSPIGMPSGKWGIMIDFNFFTTSESDRAKYAAHGCDSNSLVGDPLFIAPHRADFRVKEESPAIKIGFINFPMDRFGVQCDRLKKLARTPPIPTPRIKFGGVKPVQQEWIGAIMETLPEGWYSAYGLSKETKALRVAEVKKDSVAEKIGLRKGDLLLRVGDTPAASVENLPKDYPTDSSLRIEVFREGSIIRLR